jgi:hypothetical protein
MFIQIRLSAKNLILIVQSTTYIHIQILNDALRSIHLQVLFIFFLPPFSLVLSFPPISVKL